MAVPEKYVNIHQRLRPVLFLRRTPERTVHESVELIIPGKMDD